MANFETQVPGAGPLQVAFDDQRGARANKVYHNGTSNTETPYWDPPTSPVPWQRAPAERESVTTGRSGTRMLAFGQPAVSESFATLGLPAANEELTRIDSRDPASPGSSRAKPPLKLNYDGRIEAENPGGLGLAVNQEWFERLHIQPGQLALGNILQTQIRTIELFNAFRRPPESIDWTTFVNNAGAGVTVTNLPGLPFTIFSKQSFIANVQVSTAGPPSINGTLDFTFGAPFAGTFPVLVTGNRITIFQYRPQAPIREEILFKTDVIEKDDGTEQRIKLRGAPRSRYRFNVLLDDIKDRDLLNNTLFDWQGRVFGVPVWHESKPLGAPLAINDTVITVDTSDADYRADSLVFIYDDNFNFEALEIQSFDAVSITTKTGVSQAFDGVNTLVMPTRTAYTIPRLRNQRFAIGPSNFAMEFLTLDNVDLSDASAFPTFQGAGQSIAKPYLDRLNFMPGVRLVEGNTRRTIRLDTETGVPIQLSPWLKGKPTFPFGFEAKSQAEVYEWRQLAHFLAGRHTSFYVPTGRRDFKLTQGIGNGATAIFVENVGFTNFVAQNTPRSDFQLIRTDGTTSRHEITSSTVISDDEERIDFTPGISPAATIAEVDRIEYMTLARIADDKMTLTHQRPGESRVDLQTIGVPA